MKVLLEKGDNNDGDESMNGESNDEGEDLNFIEQIWEEILMFTS